MPGWLPGRRTCPFNTSLTRSTDRAAAVDAATAGDSRLPAVLLMLLPLLLPLLLLLLLLLPALDASAAAWRYLPRPQVAARAAAAFLAVAAVAVALPPPATDVLLLVVPLLASTPAHRAPAAVLLLSAPLLDAPNRSSTPARVGAKDAKDKRT